ncbi:putative spermidine/putrescine transport system substrate-binding protein, partial [Sinorhizobium meliloti]
MQTTFKHFAFGAALLLSAMPFAARSQDVAENLKGTGEVVITSGGGT